MIKFKVKDKNSEAVETFITNYLDRLNAKNKVLKTIDDDQDKILIAKTHIHELRKVAPQAKIEVRQKLVPQQRMPAL